MFKEEKKDDFNIFDSEDLVGNSDYNKSAAPTTSSMGGGLLFDINFDIPSKGPDAYVPPTMNPPQGMGGQNSVPNVSTRV